MTIRKMSTAGLAACGVLASWLGMPCAAPAAPTTFAYDFSFGAAGPGASTFFNPEEVAVDQRTGDVYVYDSKTPGGAVYKFNAAGQPGKFTGLPGESSFIEGVGSAPGGNAELQIAVDSSNGPAQGDIYIANGTDIGIYGEDGKPVEVGGKPAELNGEVAGPWGEPCGVAVDVVGNVYVGLYSKNSSHVNRYTPSANPVTNSDYAGSLWGVNQVCNVSADSEGNALVDSWPSGPVAKYPSSQFSKGETKPIGSLVDARGQGLTVDLSTNETYVDESRYIAIFGSFGGLLNTIPVRGTRSYGVAIDSATGELYVTDLQSNQIDAFKRVPALAPTADDQPPSASAIGQTGAILNGTIDPGGTNTTYRFLYVDAADYNPAAPNPYEAGQATEAANTVGVFGDTGVSGNLDELSPSTTYHYALEARNAAGSVRGPDHTFTTALSTPPAVATGPASGVTQNDATVAGTVGSRGLATTFGFEIGTSPSDLGPATGLGAVGAGVNEAPVALTLHNLRPATTYYYRVIATNVDGTSEGSVETFTTATFANAFVAPPAPLPFVSVPNIAFPSEAKVPVVKKKAKKTPRHGKRKKKRRLKKK